MDSTLDIAASGLEAAGAILNAAAQNMANAQTQGYRPELVELLPVNGGGVEVDRMEQTGYVDPVAQSIEFQRARYLYDANAQVIAVEEQTFGSLLNILDSQPPQQPDASDNS